MSIAGFVSTGIFVITLLTVVAAVLAYAIFRARERRRGGERAQPGREVPLEYFIEYRLPESQRQDAPTLSSHRPDALRARMVLVGGLTVAVLGVSAAAYVTVPRLHARWTAERAALLGGTGPRPPLPVVSTARRGASLFPSASLDQNRDGRIQPAERARLRERVPQFIFVTSDDNGSSEGVEWLRAQLGPRGVFSHLTFFMTGNYLPGRPSYLGGPVEASWQAVLDEAQLGLHGLSHAEGAETWTVERWATENRTVQDEIERRFNLPPGWSWERYPWGSRAPFLVLTDAYFASLADLRPRPVYDSSLSAYPTGTRMVPPRPDVPRDVTWPFTLDGALPDDIDPPYLPISDARATFTAHSLWEVPVYGWWIHPPKGKPQWQPSLDYNLWKFFGCEGSAANEEIVAAVLENLAAHEQGNRAPFHIGFHASSFVGDEACHRATTVRLFQRLDEYIGQHAGVQYASIPEVLAWMEQHP